MEGLWAFVVIGGPILLALALIFAKISNQRSRSEKRLTEEAVHRQREDAAREGS
jgi:hypothetical protein